MGVQGLWELLAPVGRRVSVETLAGKRLAIDASIWMVQFMMAMRDERGEMVRNAHVLGFFRRICKLLFLRTKPIFVFDGATPVLKRRTVAARRRHRENARAKIRKTAEKLLLNQLKKRRLEELAAEIKSGTAKEEAKGKKVMEDKGSGVEGSSLGKGVQGAVGSSSQESLDELLAASLAAEEEWKSTGNESTLGRDIAEEGDDGDENEEMLLPVMNGNIDPAVLASLPPSMQLDLLVQMRERLMAENRQKYQKIKKAPTKFSELQIQSYLKTVAFRREIDEVQKYASGKGVGGVQTSRIASEANREFIFSSSFTGDKQMLASSGTGKNKGPNHTMQTKASSSDTILPNSVSKQSSSVIGAYASEPVIDFVNDVETYRDERGRIRVSRVRGMGICMTRDLQRNLDMMKEYEQEKIFEKLSENPRPNYNKMVLEVPNTVGKVNQLPKSFASSEDSGYNNSSSISAQDAPHCVDGPSLRASKAPIEISFLDDDAEKQDDDNLFFQLVSGGFALENYSASVPSVEDANDSSPDCIWEEGVVEKIDGTIAKNLNKQTESSLAYELKSEEDDVCWEDGVCQAPDSADDHLGGQERHISRGALEEETEIQEAIRLSLEDFGRKPPFIPSGEHNGNTHPQLENYQKDHPSPCASPGQSDCTHPKDTVQSGNSSQNHFSSGAAVEVQTESRLSATAENTKSVLLSNTKFTENTMTVCVNNAPTTKTGEDWLTLDEVPLNISTNSANEPRFRLPTGLDTSSVTSKVTKGSTPDILLADHLNTDLLVSQESGSFQKHEIAIEQKHSSVEEDEGTKLGIYIERAKGENISNKISIIREEYQKEKLTTPEHFNDHNIEVSEARLDEEISQLSQEWVNLGDEQRKLERNSESVSSEMFAECQELLQMFGLPYIIAPMEAEAQCAYMEMTKQVDGVITDDSDVFLFGARGVYKNIFDDKKYVETYFMKDIENELGLSREKLIRMALLLGSDYTEGVSGIGIVNAIEVLHAFPEQDGLQNFREWLESPDPSILEPFGSQSDSKSKKRFSRTNINSADVMAEKNDGSPNDESGLRRQQYQSNGDGLQDVKNTFMDKHRKVSKNWHIPSSFPSESVISAYTAPQVDESVEPFSWGKPDLFLLRKLCWEKFGWSNQKADELLLPVLKEYNKHETQLRLEAFFSFNERFAKIRSQRIKKAVKGITGSCSAELTDYLGQEGSKSIKKRKPSSSQTEEQKYRSCSDVRSNNDKASNSSQLEMGSEASPILGNDGRSADSGMTTNIRGKIRGRGRGGGKGRGKGGGRGRVEVKSMESSNSSSSDDCHGHNMKPEDKLEHRRSVRHRKHVKYAEESFEGSDDAGVLNETSTEQKPAKDAFATLDDWVNKDRDQVPVEDSLPRDYLCSGGGFCMDESDQNGDAFDQDNSVRDFLVEFPLQNSTDLKIAESMDHGSLPGQDDPRTKFNEPITECSQVQNNDSGAEQAAGKVEAKPALTAMPLLKRKRQKTRTTI